MMKRILFSVILLMSYVCAFAQAPQAINYQAIARDANGNVLIEKQVSIKLAILRSSATGTVIYEETHTATSGKTGVVNLQIGKGTAVTGTFATIDWSQSPYFIRFSMDINGGTSYKEVATTQMLSVPYALYAETAGTVNGVTPSANQDFLVFSDTEAELFAGVNPEIEHYSHSGIRGSVLYLNSEDQEVKYELKGIPSGIAVEDDTSASGKYGRYLYFYLRGYADEENIYECQLILTNRYGVTKAYPFTLKTYSRPTTELPGYELSDEDYMNAKNSMLEQYHSFFTLNQVMDKAFMGISSSQDFVIYKDKTYTPSSLQILEYWQRAYSLMRSVNYIIGYLEKENDLSDFRKNILAQAMIVRSYTYLKLAEWFNGAPLILKVLNIGDEEIYSPRSTRKQLLYQVIFDLTNSYRNVQMDGTPNITFEEAERMLYEAYLLDQSWHSVSDRIDDSKSALMKFYKKVAQYKSGELHGVTQSSLISEFMEQHYSVNNQGNLLLNILEYSVEYFGWDEDEKYKAILPIPISEVQINPNMIQNPGY